jgi:hypothetical protein
MAGGPSDASAIARARGHRICGSSCARNRRTSVMPTEKRKDAPERDKTKPPASPYGP